ncbi:MAG: alcohol dehydrogenase catalytic domain-containing protein [Deltaproteobacteria bacterium]|jgi:threonine dehydrogenase-like Zn-dependent dehydrogenase|nr:alcohol dehydrogenase catalytic domain-containing protein [Deltaproteobacteria bacterium]
MRGGEGTGENNNRLNASSSPLYDPCGNYSATIPRHTEIKENLSEHSQVRAGSHRPKSPVCRNDQIRFFGGGGTVVYPAILVLTRRAVAGLQALGETAEADGLHFCACILLGHETSGTVVKSGKKVGGFKPGDRVIAAYTYCGECRACKDDRTYQCDHMHHFFSGERLDGSTPFSLNGMPVFPLMRQGGFSTFTVCHEKALTRAITALDLKSSAPIGCGVMTGAGSVMNYLKPEKGKSLAVFGTGAVGLSAVLAAGVCGCDPIIAVDEG